MSDNVTCDDEDKECHFENSGWYLGIVVLFIIIGLLCIEPFFEMI